MKKSRNQDLETLDSENMSLNMTGTKVGADQKSVSSFSDLPIEALNALSEEQKMQAAARQHYGQGIADHIMKLESTVDLTGFLDEHKISADYRAKMVDWMVEVLTTFKCSDQAFFKTVQIMDRYYAEIGKPTGTSSLHMTGVVAMFIATKYEDIIPLLMRTIVNKVGHGKFTKQQVNQKELEILRVLKFNLGAPTVLEHLERMSAELGIED